MYFCKLIFWSLSIRLFIFKARVKLKFRRLTLAQTQLINSCIDRFEYINSKIKPFKKLQLFLRIKLFKIKSKLKLRFSKLTPDQKQIVNSCIDRFGSIDIK